MELYELRVPQLKAILESDYQIEAKLLKSDLIDLLSKLKNGQITVKNASMQNSVESACKPCEERVIELEQYRVKLHELKVNNINLNKKISNLCDSINLLNEKILSLEETITSYKIKTRSVMKQDKAINIVLLSDSHGRNLNSILGSQLKSDAKIFSVVKPNATYAQVTSDVVSETANLTDTDLTIILAGSNDIDRKVYPKIKDIIDSINNCNKSNVIVCSVPYRYDSANQNEWIYKFNLKLAVIIDKLAKISKNRIDLFDINAVCVENRLFYTKNGLHLSYKGKCAISEALANKFILATSSNTIINKNLIFNKPTVLMNNLSTHQVESTSSTIISTPVSKSTEISAEPTMEVGITPKMRAAKSSESLSDYGTPSKEDKAKDTSISPSASPSDRTDCTVTQNSDGNYFLD